MPHRQRATHSVQQCVYATLGNAPISIYCETETEMNLKGETTSAAAAGAGAAVFFAVLLLAPFVGKHVDRGTRCHKNKLSQDTQSPREVGVPTKRFCGWRAILNSPPAPQLYNFHSDTQHMFQFWMNPRIMAAKSNFTLNTNISISLAPTHPRESHSNNRMPLVYHRSPHSCKCIFNA